MAPDTIDHQIRALPLYRLGVSAGMDIGLKLALDALTAEQVRQEQRHADADPAAAARISYGLGCLARVMQTVAAIFRSAN